MVDAIKETEQNAERTPILMSCLLQLLALVTPTLSFASVVEEVIEVPVSVRTIYGREVNQPIKVTVFRDNQRAKAPYLVLNHGRPGADPAALAKMGRQRFPENSRYFVSLGFTVFVPTRVGYGVSGGIDVEDSGRCDSRNYATAFDAAAVQTIAILNAAKDMPFVDLSRGLIVGHSVGGMTTIALSTRALPGLRGAVNFAGGAGGDPKSGGANACSQNRITALYKDYGAASKVPTLWLYSENDRYFETRRPKEWFAAFVDAGGKGQFVQLPPFKDDGHVIFTRNPDSWKAEFEKFIHDVGLYAVDKQ